MWRSELEEIAKTNIHPAWGYSHSKRIYNISLMLAQIDKIKIDEEIIFAASLIHDFGALEKYKKDGVDHSVRSTDICNSILEEIKFPNEKIALVKKTISGHMFYSEPFSSNEAIIFRDADILDFLGFIGITRLLSIVGKDELTPDLESAIKLIKQFYNVLPKKLLTNAGKQNGKIKQNEMKNYLNIISEETLNFSLL